MPSTGQFLAFLGASVVFLVIPGPSLLFTIGRALTVGRRDALYGVVGNQIGSFCQVVGAAVGLGALLAASATAFMVLKLVGAAYVIYLGVQAIRHRGDARLALEASGTHGPTSAWSSLRAGMIVGGTNPKTAVFLAAFLPQFIDPTAPAIPQLILLGAILAVMALVSDGAFALAASRAREWFGRRPERLDRFGGAGGVMMIGLGASLVVTGGSQS